MGRAILSAPFSLARFDPAPSLLCFQGPELRPLWENLIACVDPLTSPGVSKLFLKDLRAKISPLWSHWQVLISAAKALKQP